MRIVSVNVSPVQEVLRGGSIVRTGIFKQPTAARLSLGERGLAGDDQADKRHHGWPTQALYAFSAAEYEHWRQHLGRFDLEYGRFGENLTVDGLDDEAICIGDIYRIASARVQVTFPRVPCSTLAMAVDDPSIVKAFLKRGRCGPYFAVLSPGEIGVGDPIELEFADPTRLSLFEAMHLMHFATDARERWAQASAIHAMDSRWKTKFAAKAKEAQST